MDEDDRARVLTAVEDLEDRIEVLLTRAEEVRGLLALYDGRRRYRPAGMHLTETSRGLGEAAAYARSARRTLDVGDPA